MPDNFTYTGAHASVLPGGQPVEPGQPVTVDSGDDEVRALIDAGVLTSQDAKPAPPAPVERTDPDDEEPEA